MARFEVQGHGIDSGRRRKRVYAAFDEHEARCRAEADGIVVVDIKLLPGDPPTEKQLVYAKDLKIDIPTGATKDDLSDLISLAVEKDKPSTERDRAFARRYMVEVTDYIGKRALLDKILYALKQPGYENDLVAWFTYRVYRELVSGAEDAPIEGPDHPIIQGIAVQLQNDDSILKSIGRYEGRDLIWFGEYTAPSGSYHTGGSNRTNAYKRVSTLLRERIAVPPRERHQPSEDRRVSSTTSNVSVRVRKPAGCLSLVMFVAILASCAAYFLVLWTDMKPNDRLHPIAQTARSG